MKKFLVMVNCKYLVAVEAETHGGAEHRILDDIYYGIETCQAFSMADLSTEFFRDVAAGCETISLSEMAAKAEAYKQADDAENEARQKIAANERRIQVLREELASLESDNDLLESRIINSRHERIQIW